MKKLLCLVLALLMLCGAAGAESFSANPDAIETIAESVLMLKVYDASNNEIATGSGFVMFDNMTLVTNYHVIEGAHTVIADSDEGYQYFVTHVLVADKEKDIAILHFMAPTVMQPLESSLQTVKRGSKVVAIGSPIGLKNTVSIGNVSATFEENGVNWIQFTAPISHGSSGGAVLNDNGKVVGVSSAFFEDGQNLNLAIDISNVVKLYNEWDGKTRNNLVDYFARNTITPSPTAQPTITPMPEPIYTVPPLTVQKKIKQLNTSYTIPEGFLVEEEINNGEVGHIVTFSDRQSSLMMICGRKIKAKDYDDLTVIELLQALQTARTEVEQSGMEYIDGKLHHTESELFLKVAGKYTEEMASFLDLPDNVSVTIYITIRKNKQIWAMYASTLDTYDDEYLPIAEAIIDTIVIK